MVHYPAAAMNKSQIVGAGKALWVADTSVIGQIICLIWLTDLTAVLEGRMKNAIPQKLLISTKSHFQVFYHLSG